jgi:hypothetical protein
MRQGDTSEELPAPREPAEEDEPAFPHPDRRGAWEHGPPTPADRVAARRRLDRQADRWW